MQASLCDKSLTVSQTAALILVEWAEEGDKFTDAVVRPLAAHLVSWKQAATDPAKESVKGEPQSFVLLRAGLTCDIETEARLTAVTAIRRVAEKNDPESNQAVAGQPLRQGPTASQTAA